MNKPFHLTELEESELLIAEVDNIDSEKENQIISLLNRITELQQSYIETLQETIELQKEKVNLERLIDEYKKHEL
tara:strand:+ start:656 stop:880 length:225 start_codon:yes stop_codon:yes gene_type:complete